MVTVLRKASVVIQAISAAAPNRGPNARPGDARTTPTVRSRGIGDGPIPTPRSPEFPFPSTTSVCALTPNSTATMYTISKSSGFCDRKPGHETRSSASLFRVQRQQSPALWSDAPRFASVTAAHAVEGQETDVVLSNTLRQSAYRADHQPEEELFRCRTANGNERVSKRNREWE